MKKMILTTILCVIALSGIFGQTTVNTLSVSASQDTSCVGSTVNLQFTISNGSGSPLTFSGVTFKIQFNNMSSPTIIGTTPTMTVTIPANSTTSTYTVSGVLPSIVNGLYNIRVKMYSGNTALWNTSPVVPHQIYVLNAPSTPTVTPSGPLAICAGNSVTLTSSSAPNYTWNTGATTQAITITPSVSGTYTVATQNQCGQSTSAPVNITVSQLPLVSISASGPTTFCAGQSVNLSSTLVGFGTIIWSNSQPGSNIVVNTTGNYYAIASNTCGVDTSNVIPVTVNPLPTINTVTSNTLICAGQSATLTASGANTYSWNTGATTSNLTVSPTTTTTYTVIGTNANGCSNTSIVTQNVSPLPNVVAVTNTPMLCVGQQAILTASGASTYSWNTSATTNTITVSPTSNTTYTVIGTNSAGCSNATTITQNVSTCTGIENANSNSIINNVYPIPASENVNIELSNVNDNSNVVVNIYSIEGKLVKTENVNFENNKTSVNVSSINDGFYSLEIVAGQQKSTKRIVIAH